MLLVSFLISLAGAAPKPNIVVIVGDDMGYADVGFHGCKDIPTPHLNALAASGTRFSSGYVSGPYCSPTRAGLMTGRYQQRFGHEFNPSGNAGKNGLPLKEKTLPQRLKNADYATGMVSKWHLGNSDAMQPDQRGFGSFFGFLGGAHDYFNPAGILRGNTQAGDRSYLTDAFGREAVKFIDNHKKNPFFLYLAFNAVHTPLQADEKRLQQFSGIANKQRRTYAAMMSAMDDAIGKVLAKLKEEKIDENTLIFFISDNGGPTMNGVSVNGASNLPLRGSKRTTLEGGVRVPFIVSWPGKIPAGVVDDRPVIQIDILPTALAAAGVGVGEKAHLDGVNLLPYLDGRNKEAPHDALYWRFGKQNAIRQGDWKLVRYDEAAEGGKGVSPARLYNLKNDIGESKDLSQAQPDKVRQLQSAWDRWNAGNVTPLWSAEGKLPKN
ncbi:MAG: sulfatase [Gemmataceae bacterium]